MEANYMMKDNRKAENNELRRLFLCGSLMSQMILTEQTDVKGIALQWQDQVEKVRKTG